MVDCGALDLVELLLAALFNLGDLLLVVFAVLDLIVELSVDELRLLLVVDLAYAVLVDLAADHLQDIRLVPALWDG